MGLDQAPSCGRQVLHPLPGLELEASSPLLLLPGLYQGEELPGEIIQTRTPRSHPHDIYPGTEGTPSRRGPAAVCKPERSSPCSQSRRGPLSRRRPVTRAGF